MQGGKHSFNQVMLSQKVEDGLKRTVERERMSRLEDLDSRINVVDDRVNEA